MTKNKSLRRALIMSVISILVCSAMLVGATFAWFSDTVSTGVNTIIAGNLKVDIQDTDGNSLVNEELFNLENVLWEPGMMFVSDPFVIANIGTVALQYYITTVMEDINKTLAGHGLSEVIGYKVVAADDVDVDSIDDTTIARAEFWASITDGAKSDTLEAGAKSDELVVVLYWAPTANDNLYNVTVDETTDGEPLTTNFSISVYATQVSSEKDGIGPGYDAAVGSFERVHQTISNGVDLLNNGTDMGNYAHLSDLVEVEEGHYVSYVTLDTYGTKYDEELGDTRPVTIGDVYFDIAETLFGEVISQSESIYSIKVVIDGYDVESTDEEYNPWVSNGGELTQNDIVWGPCAKAMVAFLIAEGESADMSTLKYILEEAPVTLMAGHTINVTMTTMDGTVTVYTLDFSLTAAESEALASLHDALINGVDAANGEFENIELGDKIVIAPIEFVEGKYIAEVTFTEQCESYNDIGQGYIAISELLANLVKQLSSEGIIAGVKVGGVDLIGDELVENLEQVDKWVLTVALAEWGYNDLLSADQQKEIDDISDDSRDINRLLAIAEIMLQKLDGAAFDVEFTDADGNSVSYTLSFSVLATDLDGSLYE